MDFVVLRVAVEVLKLETASYLVERDKAIGTDSIRS